jgi:hypothetical protein
MVYVLMHACFTGAWHLHLNLTFFICEYGTLNFLMLQSWWPGIKPGITVYCLGIGDIECPSTLGS